MRARDLGPRQVRLRPVPRPEERQPQRQRVVAAIHHVGQQHPALAGGQLQVVAHFLDGESVAGVSVQAQRMLAQVVRIEHGLDFRYWVNLAYLEIWQLAVGVRDEVIEKLVEHFVRAGSLDLNRLAQRVEVA